MRAKQQRAANSIPGRDRACRLPLSFACEPTDMNQPTDPAELARLAERVAALRQEHRALDAEIERMQVDIAADELAVKRLKRRKLQLKDLIARLESALIPDEPA